MSAFHNSSEGERLALRFHAICAGVGFLHLALGAAIIVWHWRGMNDHKQAIKRLESA